ncbi:tRNA lysidine(34) synthetase TilS [Bizionia gelidisalsuginis]|uniref:tRNA(Ile)-lysidine synthase n=1 Tax=Bizionia gelidisalsuginis TaxID=291188 RepID=A0ABY3MC23_9FLAO|nr:tRNA lysidine(34) synthetase TilS [Bizionia gelidisalsuginis]TYC14829.1 tRNA lysidine(34) synthetase TilS [Bizionia gelidisalsuginis]
MQNTFKNHIDKQLPFLKDSRLLIAISGGLDSVVLTHLCKNAGLNLALAHCNFNLRPGDCDQDETFVMALADALDTEVFVQSFDTNAFSEAHKISTQMAARDLRYTWFNELITLLKFDYVLTAHHADDALETVLINLSRGTGLDGLTGIPEVNETVVRPLLPFSRAEIENYAKINNIEWREDSSNASTKYLRNKLRHDIIPQLKEINPQFLSNFKNTLSHLKASQAIVNESLDLVLKEAVLFSDAVTTKFSISVLQDLKSTEAFLYEIFKDFGFNSGAAIGDLMTAQSGKQLLSDTHLLLKNRAELVLTLKSESDGEDCITITQGVERIKINSGTLVITEVASISEHNANTVFVDKDSLQFPLTVRAWENGDYFYPLGMQGKKKLSKFFKDEKLSVLEKERAELLCTNDDIVWVINKRLDNRFKVTENTTQILKITIEA